MASGHTVTTSGSESSVSTTRDRPFSAAGTRQIGYRSLLLLGFVLPFDLQQRPLLWTEYLSITDLTVALLIVSILALQTVLALVAAALRGSPDATRYFSQRRVALALLVAFLVSCSISTFMAGASAQSGTWFLGVVTGALLWLALPLWLAEDTVARIHRLGMSLIAGALVASVIGFVEVAMGPDFDQNLLFFKFGPSTMGPWLRLSSTFSSANVAAMYFELALPCAVVGLTVGLQGGARRHLSSMVWLVVIDILFIAVGLTYSRGALLGLLAAGLAMMLAGRSGLGSRLAGQWRGTAVGVANLALVAGFFVISSSSTELLRFSTQNDRAWYQVAYSGTVPASLPAGKVQTIPVTVQNQSPLLWNASRPHTYGLSYHWLYPSRKVERFTNPITWLLSDVAPGARRTVRVRVTAPEAPGTYLLSWDTIWKGTTWFSPKTGLYPTSATTVNPSRPSGAVGHIPTPDIAVLPTAPALDRRQIWGVALRMIEHRPLFGVGSQGVRMNYTAFAPFLPADQRSKPPPHAHNLALEMLADWGLTGGGIFATLLIILWWPLLRTVVRGDVISAWQLAVIGAAAALLGHQLVDYFLTKQAMFAVFWLLCGLAATMDRTCSLGCARESSSNTR